MVLKATEAYDMLIDDVIYKQEDLKKPENRWVLHCVFTAIASKRIAEKLGLDANHAMALGYIHDIGRKVSHPDHAIEGYNYVRREGYPKYAGICLTHSFIDNDINMTAGGGPNTPQKYELINNYLMTHQCTIYDNIVQMCDLFCLETGFTTVENRLLDITKRKGVYPNSLNHFHKAMELKERLETQMGCSLYDLFPEITPEDKARVDSDRNELVALLEKPTKTL